MDAWLDGCMDGWMDVCIDACMDDKDACMDDKDACMDDKDACAQAWPSVCRFAMSYHVMLSNVMLLCNIIAYSS